MNTVKVYNALNEIEANMIVSMLKEAGIPAYYLGAGAGDILEVNFGFSVYGKDIYVMEKDEKQAREIIKELISEENQE